MKTRAGSQHELYKKYQKLERCKIYAIKKAIALFYNIPLEEQDMEYVAWKAFLEVEEKYKPKTSQKTYQSFFMDCLYWKVKDYCKKFTNNKHRVCNDAGTVLNNAKGIDYISNFKDSELLKKMAIEDYVIDNKDNYKSVIVKMYQEDSTIDEMCVALQCSRTKLYKCVAVVREELSGILSSQAAYF